MNERTMPKTGSWNCRSAANLLVILVCSCLLAYLVLICPVHIKRHSTYDAVAAGFLFMLAGLLGRELIQAVLLRLYFQITIDGKTFRCDIFDYSKWRTISIEIPLNEARYCFGDLECVIVSTHGSFVVPITLAKYRDFCVAIEASVASLAPRSPAKWIPGINEAPQYPTGYRTAYKPINSANLLICLYANPERSLAVRALKRFKRAMVWAACFISVIAILIYYFA
jgi:hypothetical protein